MRNCGKCGEPIGRFGRKERHVYVLGGMTVELFDSVVELHCDACGESAIIIPNLDGLIAATAIARVQEPTKLNGREIRFLRKALGVTGKELAGRMNVQPETVSRWEADRMPINPQNETILRVLVAGFMKDRAPAMEVKLDAILTLKVSPIRNGFDDQPMQFELVKLKDNGKKEPHWDTSDGALAA